MFKDKLISIFLALIIVLKLVDLYIDYSEEIIFVHLIQELVLIVLATSLFVYLVIDIRVRSRSIQVLKRQIGAVSVENKEISEQLAKAKKDFSEAIQLEFDQWGLTSSEKVVGLLLLKGFSIGEIAALRNTSEKTIRHQASAVYRKSDCPGRYNLAAHFFETLN
ncbi:helix-turn-helix transcriptional regulator [Pseudidiomarina taiwanensis]|uniref:Helix-turn-helix transcriptional regulator n=1 Tax=Pseudidiomarina taiwanensis TaxID=337250 RepID=A0A432ZGQ2_9GAMM|nr:response regulator transcription factor [Pseudidiomarina taiwanensis]RUO76492.1 helix-turn-helix transcriptional regulator [Pseudidiomarina taiwanensis]